MLHFGTLLKSKRQRGYIVSKLFPFCVGYLFKNGENYREMALQENILVIGNDIWWILARTVDNMFCKED